ncbi:hypothetical protein K438DRAFT_1777711 [Mycena galopus ATCC 62051]|nr:hypothetical protein K438DRAFT_1777711 [Mycena galopus ATCC 62051]
MLASGLPGSNDPEMICAWRLRVIWWRSNRKKERPDGDVRVPDLHRHNREAEKHTKAEQVPPIRHLRVVVHQLDVDIAALDAQLLHAIEQAPPVVQHRRGASTARTRVVLVPEAVVRDVGADGEVREVPRVGVVQRGGEDPEEQDEAEEDVYLGTPRDHERGPDPGDLIPVEGEDAHAQPARDAEELVNGDVVGCGPADKGEDREGLEEEAWTKKFNFL